MSTNNELRNHFEIKFEQGYYGLHLDGMKAEMFAERGMAEEFVDSVIRAVMVGDMDYKTDDKICILQKEDVRSE